MARLGPDIGPYKIDNVRIQLASENVRDGVSGLKRTAAQSEARSAFMQGNTNSVGRTLSIETREKIRRSNIATKREQRLARGGVGQRLAARFGNETSSEFDSHRPHHLSNLS